MSIKAYLLLFMGVLAAAAIAAAGTVMMIELGELAEATRTERLTRAFGGILEIQQRMSSERGHFNARLVGDVSNDDIERRVVSDSDRAFDEGVELLKMVRVNEALAERLEEIRSSFLGLRADAIGQLETGRLNERFASRYATELTALVGQLEAIAGRVERAAAVTAGPLARSYVELAQLVGIMRGYADRRASQMIAVVGTNTAVTAESVQDLTGPGRVQATWQRIEEVLDVMRQITATRGVDIGADLEQAMAGLQQLYFGDLEVMYQGIIASGRNGVPLGVTLTELHTRQADAMDAIGATRIAALDHAQATAVQEAHAAHIALMKALALVLLVFGGSTLAVVMLRRKVIAPLGALTRILIRLAENDRAVTVPELPRRDEIGQLAQAIETLRANAEHAATVERERQMMEMQLRQAQKLESLGTLAGGIAHEINTPTQYVGDNIRFLETSFADIRTVLEHATALRAAAASEPRLAALASALQNAETSADLDFLCDEIPTAIAQSLDGVDRIRQIVLAVKEFSHPDAREMSPIDLNHAIETTITVCRNQWKYIAELETALAAGLPPVPCRGGEINQVFLNLIVNAAHAIEAKGQGNGKITVTTACRDGWAEITVADTGTGIPPEIRARIFDPFFTTKAPGKGTGQGLAICHTIVVQKHGGSITVDSQPGEGTCFIVRLPLEARPEAVDGLGLAA